MFQRDSRSRFQAVVCGGISGSGKCDAMNWLFIGDHVGWEQKKEHLKLDEEVGTVVSFPSQGPITRPCPISAFMTLICYLTAVAKWVNSHVTVGFFIVHVSK